VLVAIYGYAVQIFCDFSGYTDMAIGLALLLGIRFPMNFDRPYTASSLQDFWRRWHITLSSWLRDYLYISLGGNRGGKWATSRNLMITMLLGGLWHGAAWTFVIWGGIHGIGLVIERFLRERFRWAMPRIGSVIQHVVTFHIVVIAWVFFRAPSLSIVGDLFGRLFTWGSAQHGGQQVVTAWVLILIVGGVAAQWINGSVRARALELATRAPWALQAVVAGVVLVVMITVVDNQGVAPFIYFRF
jgi:D-alanyl-lipoteichoic acid acyltransferase DltB (MBOAT superfamily)